MNGRLNPSSPHAQGRAAAAAIEKARRQVGSLIGAKPEEILFTSSGTEANAWALEGLSKSVRRTSGPPGTSYRPEIVISAVEHLSILQTARRMEKEGWSVTVVPVDSFGRVDPDRVEAALTLRAALVSIQWANPEVGTLQPVAEIARRVKARGILFHADAIAAAGRVPVSIQEVPADAVSIASAPLGGPPGAAALFLRKGVRILPLFLGGTQEQGRRAGTENVPGITGFGAAAESAAQGLPEFALCVNPLREELLRGILNLLPEARMNGDPTQRLPGHLSVSFPGADSEALLLALDREGVSVGLGSACSAKAVKASHVLKAMGVEDKLALGTLVLSLSRHNRVEEIERFLQILPGVLGVIGKENK